MKASVAWPMGVVGVFFVSLSVCGTTVYLATSTPAVVTDSDYYEQAVRWDEIAAEQRASERLGWTLRVEAGGEGVLVRVSDTLGRAIEGGSFESRLFSHAAPGVSLRERGELTGDGARVGGALAPGMWRLSLRAERGPEVFVRTVDFEVAAGETLVHEFDAGAWAVDDGSPEGDALGDGRAREGADG
ncbi:MAG: FixH family protein [Planctomycetota bacterium]